LELSTPNAAFLNNNFFAKKAFFDNFSAAKNLGKAIDPHPASCYDSI